MTNEQISQNMDYVAGYVSAFSDLMQFAYIYMQMYPGSVILPEKIEEISKAVLKSRFPDMLDAFDMAREQAVHGALEVATKLD